MESLTVELGARSYPIKIGHGLVSDHAAMSSLLASAVRGRQVLLVTNATVGGLYAEHVRKALADCVVDTFEIGDGERFKSLATYADVMDFLIEKRHNRTTCVIALGGGVVGDLAGFVAATYQRGVDFVQIPTTLLAQVDSSVGGKTAVNHVAAKNMIGAFYQPRCVLIDTAVLDTLPPREYAAGLAEVVKYGIIEDADFFAWLEKNSQALLDKDAAALIHVVRRSCEIKAQVVNADEREAGVRAILNFGHTFGHAIESLTEYGTYLHGEAVAIGMVMAMQFSERLQMAPQGSAARVADLLTNLHLPVDLGGLQSAQRLHAADFLDAMGLDKKAHDGRLRFVLADDIGKVQVSDRYSPDVLLSLLKEFC
jgi:3-dehydroquinate synthase